MDSFFISQDMPENNNNGNNLHTPLIKIIGIGGGGVNAVNSMIDARISDVKFYAVNTDAAHLRLSKCDEKVRLGNGMGVGGDPKRGEDCANENKDKIIDMLSGANMVFITTGMGGGTGTGAAPVIAKIAKEKGILTVGVVTKPFSVEGPIRIKNAELGIKEMRQYVDAMIVIPNDKVLSNVDGKTPLKEAFMRMDDVLRQSIESVTDTITKTGEFLNIDFNDVESVLRNCENAVIGLGEGDTYESAFNKAVSNIYVEGPDIQDADKFLINITSTKNIQFTIMDLNFLTNSIRKEYKKCESLKFGNIVSEDTLNQNQKVKVSIIATFSKHEKIKEDLFDNEEEPEPLQQTLLNEFAEFGNCSSAGDEYKIFMKPAYGAWAIKRLR